MKILLYCTKAKPYLIQGFARPYHTKDINNPFNYKWHLLKTKTSSALNGKIVAECDFEVEEFDYMKAECLTHKYLDLLNKSCLTDKEMYDYFNGKNGYAIHIKNLHIFDEPKELDDYYNNKDNFITKAPQNMCYVYNDFGRKYVLISIRPEWLCKILNGEKTIEVRKKVLKEMLNDK
jgi:predicted transcriptional regulator